MPVAQDQEEFVIITFFLLILLLHVLTRRREVSIWIFSVAAIIFIVGNVVAIICVVRDAIASGDQSRVPAQYSPELQACVVCAHIFIWILHHVWTEWYEGENDKVDDKVSIDAKATANIKTRDVMVYRRGAECVVTATHEGDGEPYYTIQFADGKEKQTTSKNISHKEENDAGNSYVTRTKCSKYRKVPRCYNSKYEWARSRCTIHKEIRKERREKDRERRSTSQLARRHYVSVAKDVNHHVSVAKDVNTSSNFALNFIVFMFCAYVLHLCNHALMRLCIGDYILPNDTEIPSVPSACYLIYIMNTLLSANTSIRRIWSKSELRRARKQRRLVRQFIRCYRKWLASYYSKHQCDVRIIIKTDNAADKESREDIHYSMIHVKQLNSFLDFTLEVDLTDTTEVLMAKIELHTGMPPEKQMLYFQGKFLEKGCALEDQNITLGCAIHLNFRLGASGIDAKETHREVCS